MTQNRCVGSKGRCLTEVAENPKPPRTTEQIVMRFARSALEAYSVVLCGFAFSATSVRNLPLLRTRQCWPVHPTTLRRSPPPWTHTRRPSQAPSTQEERPR
jgi:hypothetical protein